MRTRPGEIRIKDWDDFQHYKERSPPWIRLYRKLIDNDDWRDLPDSAARLLVELWLIASESAPGGTLPNDPFLIAWKTGRASSDAPQIEADMHVLAQVGFISTSYGNASAPAIPRVQSTENRELHMVDEPTVDPWPVKPKKIDGQYDYPEPFERAWSSYPNREGSNPKVGAYKAFRARVKSGDEPDDLIQAAEHYAEHAAVKEIEGTSFVQQASTFFGPSEPFREFVDSPQLNGSRPGGDRWKGL